MRYINRRSYLFFYRVNENCCIISTINQRKCGWLGHVLRHDVLLRDVLEGRMTGKRTRGRKRLQLMSNICEGYKTAKKRAEDRCLWRVSVTGVTDLLLHQNTRRESQNLHFQHAYCMIQLNKCTAPVKQTCHKSTVTWFWQACTASCSSEDSRPRGLEAAALNSLHEPKIAHSTVT